jgi:hypothetical protein
MNIMKNLVVIITIISLIAFLFFGLPVYNQFSRIFMISVSFLGVGVAIYQLIKLNKV